MVDIEFLTAAGFEYSPAMADAKSAGPSCPICRRPVGDSEHFCYLCRASGRDVRFDTGRCEAEHLATMHTHEEVERFDAAQTIKN